MPVLTIDNREGALQNLETTESATWEQVETAIRSLDAQHRTMVTIEQDDIAYMGVGGGNGRYVVAVVTPDETNLTLVDPTKTSATEQLVTGGQLGNFPANTVVDLNAALKAARAYLETGSTDPALTWLDD